MKRALSLFLALVMVALMVPFAAIISSATGEAGTGYTPGTVFHHTDFTTLADLSQGNLTGTDLSDALAKAGYKVTNDTDATKVTGLWNDGVYLGGSDQGFAMTSATNLPADIVDGTAPHVVEVTVEFDSVRLFLFGWSTADFNPDENNSISNGTNGNSQLVYRFNNGSGSESEAPQTIDSFTAYTEDGETALSHNERVNRFVEGKSNSYYKMSIVIANGTIEKVYVENTGVVNCYKPNDGTVKQVNGYLRMWHNGWGTGKDMFVRSVKIYAGTYGDDKGNTLGTYYKYDPATAPATYTAGQVLHNVDVANVTNMADLGYHFIEGDSKAKVWLEDGAINLKGGSMKSYIKLDSDKIFPAGLGDYTLEYSMKFNPETHIAFTAFGLNDAGGTYGFSDSNTFKFRGKESAYYSSDSTKVYRWNADTSAWDPVVYSWLNVNEQTETACDRMPEDVVAALKAGAYANVKIPFSNNSASDVYVTVGDVQLKIDKNYALRATAGDIGFCQTSDTMDNYVLSFKSFRVVAGSDYDALDWGDKAENATIVDNKAQAYVYTNGTCEVVEAGSTVEVPANAIAVKTTAGYVAADDFVAEAGKGYEIVTSDDVAAMVVKAGKADLRLAQNPGVRFKTNFYSYDYDTLIDLSAAGIVSVKIGTLVTTDAYRAEVDEFTAAKLATYGETVNKTVYMDIVADATDLYADNTFAGSVIGVKAYDRVYVAVGYVTVTYADSTSATLYTGETTASVLGFANAIVEAETPNYDGYSAAEVEALKYLAARDDAAVVA